MISKWKFNYTLPRVSNLSVFMPITVPVLSQGYYEKILGHALAIVIADVNVLPSTFGGPQLSVEMDNQKCRIADLIPRTLDKLIHYYIGFPRVKPSQNFV